MQAYIKVFILLLILSSCDEPTQLDLKQTPSKIVIEGLVTNKPGYQSVKVSRSAPFYGSGNTPRIIDATVMVKDDLGNEFPFVHNPSGAADSVGVYVPQSDFTGEVGRTYTLLVQTDGVEYTASDKLLSVIPVEGLEFRINEDEQEDPNEPGKIYELLFYATEPQDEKNYYLFKFYRNDSLIFYNENDIYVNEDVMLAENIDGVPSPVYYGADDTARLEVYSLTRQGFVFFSDLSANLNNDGGGMFGPIPASPRTNISNGALGFFQVSAVEEKETVIR